MQQIPPGVPGMDVAQLDTPVLILDLDAFEYNLDKMAEIMSGSIAKVRPHAKTHKSAVIARLQMQRGAVGQCVQKVSEAEALVWAGVNDIIVTNQIVDPTKIRRLIALASIARVAVCVDSAANADDLDQEACSAGVNLRVLVELDVGAGRCGLGTPEEVLELALHIRRCRNLTFTGLQAYHGKAQHFRTLDERRLAIGATIEKTKQALTLLAAHGISCEIVGGGGTGTFELEAGSGVYTEVQPGSYVFMDADYVRNLQADGAPFSTFRQALFVITAVMSTPKAGIVHVDAGLKALAFDKGLPLVKGHPEISYTGATDEHGSLDIGNVEIALKQKLWLVPGHCDPTVDRYDWIVGFRGERVEALWPITARGCFS